jgi:hypothetical protein
MASTPYDFLDTAATPAVRAAQEANGSGEFWANFAGARSSDRFTSAEIAFIAERDSLYIATVSESGWPYVQHRGGPDDAGVQGEGRARVAAASGCFRLELPATYHPAI